MPKDLKYIPISTVPDINCRNLETNQLVDDGTVTQTRAEREVHNKQQQPKIFLVEEYS